MQSRLRRQKTHFLSFSVLWDVMRVFLRVVYHMVLVIPLEEQRVASCYILIKVLQSARHLDCPTSYLKTTGRSFWLKNETFSYCHPSLDKKHGPLSLILKMQRGSRCGHKVGIASQMRKKLPFLREKEESQLNSLGILRIRESFQILNQSVLEVAQEQRRHQHVSNSFLCWGLLYLLGSNYNTRDRKKQAVISSSKIWCVGNKFSVKVLLAFYL